MREYFVGPIEGCALIAALQAGKCCGTEEVARIVYGGVLRRFAELFYVGSTAKKCGPWGAVLLAKYKRSLMTALETEWGGAAMVREAFDRCTEAVSLLSLERVQDYDLYYRRDGRAKELLGGEEILRILKSRVDYDGESIIP